MTGKSHAIIGTATAVGAVMFVQQPVNWLWAIAAVLVGMVAALLPDLDSYDSTARTQIGLGREQIRRDWKRRRRLSILVRWVASWPFNWFARAMPHRGPTHWLITAAALTAAAFLLTSATGAPDILAVTFGLGYLSHLWADALTVAGVPLWGPFIRRPVRMLPRGLSLRTGSWAEWVIVRLSIIVAVVFALSAYIDFT